MQLVEALKEGWPPQNDQKSCVAVKGKTVEAVCVQTCENVQGCVCCFGSGDDSFCS
jgi:hypothetical protein